LLGSDEGTTTVFIGGFLSLCLISIGSSVGSDHRNSIVQPMNLWVIEQLLVDVRELKESGKLGSSNLGNPFRGERRENLSIVKKKN